MVLGLSFQCLSDQELAALMADLADDPALGISLEAQTCLLKAVLNDASTRSALRNADDASGQTLTAVPGVVAGDPEVAGTIDSMVNTCLNDDERAVLLR